MAEQRTFNPLVQGSTPWRPTHSLTWPFISADDLTVDAARAANPQAAAAYQSGYQDAMGATCQDVGASGDGYADQFCGQQDPSANASTIDHTWFKIYPGPNGQPLPWGTAWFEGCMTGLVSPSSPAYKAPVPIRLQRGPRRIRLLQCTRPGSALVLPALDDAVDPGVLAGCLAAL